MDNVYNINNQVAKIAKEHKIITDYVVKFKESLKNRDKKFFKGLATFFDFLEKDLKQHFRFEETIIFPAAISGDTQYDNVLLVLSLAKEHGMFETQLQALQSEIKQIQVSREKLSTDLIDRIKEFLDALKTHAKREITDLFPMVDANPASKDLLQVYATEMTRI